MKPGSHAPPDPDALLIAGALALGVRLGPEQVAAFRVYREEIERWSVRANITALRNPADIVRAGFLDSLACLPLISLEVERVVDVGSGAGFPAFPLKIVRPGLSFTLVEASRKKASFLRHVVRRLGLIDVRVVHLRAEDLARDPWEAGAYDLALARAVAPPPEQAHLVAPFLRLGGLLLIQVGPSPTPPGTLDRLSDLGFELVRELVPPPAMERPGRRVLAMERVGRRSGGRRFT